MPVFRWGNKNKRIFLLRLTAIHWNKRMGQIIEAKSIPSLYWCLTRLYSSLHPHLVEAAIFTEFHRIEGDDLPLNFNGVIDFHRTAEKSVGWGQIISQNREKFWSADSQDNDEEQFNERENPFGRLPLAGKTLVPSQLSQASRPPFLFMP